MRMLLKGLFLIPLFIIFLSSALWSVFALYFDAPFSEPIRTAAAVLAAGLLLGIFFRSRSLKRALLYFAVYFSAVLSCWLMIEPLNKRDWSPEYSRTARFKISGDTITVENFRNINYRSDTDFTAQWETRTFNLSKLKGVDLFFSYWGSPLIAHTIASWEFEDSGPLAISIETRREAGETYSAARGFFRQFELYYVVGSEEDLIKVRTNFRNEDVYLFLLKTPVPVAREILLNYILAVNQLADRPRWYNALTTNCTTTIRQHVAAIGRAQSWNWKILVNGRLPELQYQRKVVNTDLPFEQFKAASRVNEQAKQAADGENFSELIRRGLPPRPGLN